MDGRTDGRNDGRTDVNQYTPTFQSGGTIKCKNKMMIFSVHRVHKPVVVAKILQEALRVSWNFSSADWLHHMMKAEKSFFQSEIYIKISPIIMF